jgi:signal transduction histidine kinase
MLQLIDISNDIMYNIANGEKKLLALINATVSHEMRNPLNSIYCQNIKQMQINEKITEFLNNDFKKLPLKKIRKKIKHFQKEQNESVKI